MARTNSTTQNRIDPTRPFFAAVGTVDAAVAVARTSITEAQARLAPKAVAVGFVRVPSRVEALVSEAVSELSDTVDDLNKQYVGLAARGRTLVNRIRRQESTQAAASEAKKTTVRAKNTRTRTKNATKDTARTTAAQARKTASTAKSSAKTSGTQARKAATSTKSSATATGTSARNTAAATKHAPRAAAATTGS
jgi:heparin binding hemagglutinin HbhA